jgi:hypothetical protein
MAELRQQRPAGFGGQVVMLLQVEDMTMAVTPRFTG